MAPSPMGIGARVAADGSIDLGSGDIGILNYAYVLEQLEYAFYVQVLTTRYPGMSSTERSILTDIRNHEKAHLEFLKEFLRGKSEPINLTMKFNDLVNFADRTSVLTAARDFEDLGVSAYNGAGKLLSDGNNLSTAGKIVSVEARHAAIIRELLSPMSFADDNVVTSDTGLDVVKIPADVLAKAQDYIVESITYGNLPTM